MYDISPANDFLYPIGMGLHHSGVEVLGSEYSFASNAGIFDSTPKEAPGAKFREQIFMGVLDGGQAELNKALDELRDVYGPHDYNIIRKNCNHFATAFIWKLTGQRVPGYVNRIADVGACCACLLPRQMLENAPVGDPGADNTSATSGGSVIHRGPAAPQTNTMRAFTGKGAKLGGSTTDFSSDGLVGSLLGKVGGTANNAASKVDDLTDRREKARRAALARLEISQQHEVSNESKDK